MKAIYKVGDVMLYSNKEFNRAEGSRVWFKDGSVADLDTMEYVNRGTGEIQFRYDDELETVDSYIQNYFFDKLQSIKLSGGDIYFEIQQSIDGLNTLEIVGSQSFLNNIDIIEDRGNLNVLAQQIHSNNFIIGETYINGKRVKRNPIDGKVIIKITDKVKVSVENNGRGVGKINTPIQRLQTRINGSMKIISDAVDELICEINGSGSVLVEAVKNICEVEINGSGFVEIHSGEPPRTTIELNGSGRVEANVISNEANLILTGSGNITMRGVLEQSYEVHRGSGEVKVLSRGRSLLQQVEKLD